MSTRKPDCGDSDQVRLKPVLSATKTSLIGEGLLESRLQTAKIIAADWLAWMRMLLCIFIIRLQQSQFFWCRGTNFNRPVLIIIELTKKVVFFTDIK